MMSMSAPTSTGMAALSRKGDRFKRAELLIDVGTAALRSKFDILHPPETLKDTLMKNKLFIMPKRSRQELAIPYPKSGIVSSENMDLTLMVCVLRNTGLEEPHSSTFDCKPHEREISDGADVARLKFYRNELVHSKVKELNEQEFEEISQTLIKVIKRFSGSRFDDQIRRIMTRSLDYRAGSITWHAQEAIALVPNAFNESVLQPVKASVIRLNEQQPLHYSILGRIVFSYSMQNISEIPSIKELVYYLSVVKTAAVRHCIFVLNEYPFRKQKHAELILCQRKQYLPGLYSQYGHVKHPSLLWTRPCALDSSYTNERLFEAQLYRQHSFRTHKVVNNRLFEDSTSCSHVTNVSSSTDSTTEIECCNFSESYIENNFQVKCQSKQESEFSSSSQVSGNCTDESWYQAPGNQSEKYDEIDFESLSAIFDISTPCVARQNNLSNTSLFNVSQSDLNEDGCCVTLISERFPVIKTQNDAQNLSCDFSWYLNLTFLFVIYILIVYSLLFDIFNSRLHAASLTVIIVLLELVFIFYTL
ncbi:unnamed protein product [Mytilus coruscus]|uniref:DZIP3-like HEPN domain-containing protein n=1 Tax=Mytilus coruscus TaxID=42192 RepID=A0A6J8B866_MYTCO|nr:unnamed protein product [Mytilus coruscus]